MAKKDPVSFILRAKNRIKVLESLEEGDKISGQIEKETGMYKSHVNRALTELKNESLIECRNPDDRYYQFYRLTQQGKTVLKKAKDILKQIEE